jgi:hypothetical protein
VLVHLLENLVLGLMEFLFHVFTDGTDRKWRKKILLFMGFLAVILVLLLLRN